MPQDGLTVAQVPRCPVAEDGGRFGELGARHGQSIVVPGWRIAVLSSRQHTGDLELAKSIAQHGAGDGRAGLGKLVEALWAARQLGNHCQRPSVADDLERGVKRRQIGKVATQFVK